MQIADQYGDKQRFGLFSQPPSVAVGDTQFVKIIPPKDEMGKPVTEPKNIFPGPCRKGIGKKGLLSLSSFITVDDLYIDEL